MIVVIKKKGESKDSLFRKFSRLFTEENIIEELRDRFFYKKPSLVRKEKKRIGRRRVFKKVKDKS